MYIHSQSIRKSFGGASFYDANQELSLTLREKERRYNMRNSGYVFLDVNRENFLKALYDNCKEWNLHPTKFHKNLRDCVERGEHSMVCSYGKIREKLALKDCLVFKYEKFINLMGETKTVYVFTDKEKNIIKEFWIY